MRNNVIKGKTMEQKLRSAEAAVRRLQRKSYNMRVSSYISPFPVSAYVKEVPPDGVVLRYMFPGNGTVTNACINLVGDIKKGVELGVEVRNDSGIGSGLSSNIRKNFVKIGLDMAVLTGDMLQVVLPPNAPVSDVWVAFLWQPEISETAVKSFLLRELEDLKEPEDEGV